LQVRPDEAISLGRTGVQVTRLGVGCAWFGNLYQAVPEDAATAVLARAFELGIRLVDTAPLYGFGLAERRIAPALALVSRDDFVLSTKVGRTLRARRPNDPLDLAYDGNGPLFVDAAALYAEFDFSYEAVMRSIEESLGRLGVERLDIVLIHDPDDHYAQAVDGAYRALHSLRDEGVVGAIGAGMNQPGMLARFARDTDIDCVLLAGCYTLLDQSGAEEMLPECARRGIGVVLGGVFNTGVLAQPSPQACYKYQVVPDDVLARVRQLARICESHGVPLKAAALQFPFRHPAVTSVLTGVRSTVELDDNASLLQLPVPEAMWQELYSSGLLSSPRDEP
jgi:D-threo-aldose 1-dehydrogenase